MKPTSTLGDLLSAIPYSSFSGQVGTSVSGITCHSGEVEPGDVFAALKGFNCDGRDYAAEAVARGAVAVLSHSDAPGGFPRNVPWIVSQNDRLAFSAAAAHFYPVSHDRPRLIGVTGTNGKTTVVYLMRSIFKMDGGGGILSTIEYDDGETLREASRTTPEAHSIHRWLGKLGSARTPYAAMEVSSHSLELHRVSSLKFDGAGFTNLTRDHLDFHRTMDAYFSAKKKLFGLLKENGFCVVNVDDGYGARLATELAGRNLFKVGLPGQGNVHAEDGLTMDLDGIRGTAVTPAGRVRIESRLVGHYNLYNILFSIAFAAGLEIPTGAVEEGIAALDGVPGRLERVDAGQKFHVFVDYAHSDDALKNLLSNIKPLVGGRVITVFGCGGDRDKTKRPLMGAVSARLSDVVVLTADNSRSEDPEAIARDIEAGITPELNDSKRYIRELDRREAIRKALLSAGEGDVVVIAGKGHERTQTAGGASVPFHDPSVAAELLREVLP